MKPTTSARQVFIAATRWCVPLSLATVLAGCSLRLGIQSWLSGTDKSTIAPVGQEPNTTLAEPATVVELPTANTTGPHQINITVQDDPQDQTRAIDVKNVHVYPHDEKLVEVVVFTGPMPPVPLNVTNDPANHAFGPLTAYPSDDPTETKDVFVPIASTTGPHQTNIVIPDGDARKFVLKDIHIFRYDGHVRVFLQTDQASQTRQKSSGGDPAPR